MLAGYAWLTALLVGSLMASHTLLGFPTLQGMKLGADEAVAVTIGGTVFTDLAALLVLAVCVPIFTSGFSTTAFAIQVIELNRLHSGDLLWSQRDWRAAATANGALEGTADHFVILDDRAGGRRG
jgi:hypothetical protein